MIHLSIDQYAEILAQGALQGDPEPFAVVVPMRGLQSNNDDIHPAHSSLDLSVDGECGRPYSEAA